MEKLIQLHREVKEHPYRINEEGKYLKSYKDLLYRLSHEFYLVMENSRYKSARNMLHDFNRDISNIGRDWKYSSESNLHVERCISTIHDFIDTGRVESFWDGVGSLFRSVGMYIRYKWDENEKRYYMDIPKEKIPALIKDLEAHVVSMRKHRAQVEDSVIYSDDVIKYWEDAIKHLKTSIEN